MQHIAILNLKWGLLPKILDGRKTIESRWYKNKSAPWGKVAPGDTIYFKESGKPVTAQATVAKVLQFEGLTPAMVRSLLSQYGTQIGVESEQIENFYTLFRHKHYAILIFLQRVVPIGPFEINKSGFGAMSAWLSVESIKTIKLRVRNNRQ